MRIYLSKPHMSGSEERFVADAFKSNFIAPLGPHLDKFEDSVKEYLEDEIQLVTPAPLLDDFSHEVDRIRLACMRAC